jgi:hypothetical protein
MPSTEIFLVWMQSGEDDDPELSQTAHRSKPGATGWCDEHRKLLQGAPIAWQDTLDGNGPSRGTSARCRLTDKVEETMIYFVEPANLAD